MSQTVSIVVPNSPRVGSGTYPGGMNMSQPNSYLQRDTTSSSQALSSSEPTFTALPVHPSREPTRLPSAPTQRPGPYRGAISHHPQVSVSSHISHESFSHRRRGSTLKTVMRKIFGKKRQSILEGDETDEDPSVLRTERCNNITGGPDALSIAKARSRNSNTSPSALANQKRSLAVSRLSSASSDLFAQDNKSEIPYTVRRRATLPSLVLSDDEGNTKERTLSIVSPVSTRPISAMSTVSAFTDRRDNGDTQSLDTRRAHRRSRSADDLQALIRRHRMSPIQWRRRSKETKDWRTSVLEPYDQDTADNCHDTTDTPDNEVDPPRDNKTPCADEEDATPSNEVESPPFQAQSLMANIADPDASVDQRLTTIEVKLMDLEFAIAKMQGFGSDGLNKTAENTPEKAKLTTQNIAAYRDQLCTASETSSESSASFGGNARPISTSTLRPSMALSQPPPWQTESPSNLHSISIEQYSALVTLVRREQTARKALESQVALLQEEMQSLRRSSGLPASPPGTLYPIPSPDSDDGRYRRRRTMSSPRKTSETSAETRNSESRRRDSPYRRSRSNTGRRTPSSRTTAANMI
ncbi:hypothetical protein PISL3812_03051 [Talaromyces islandicus]|uniref:Uncharacterized protein n=1 Tax=Talaromyces islandicus TaxID=28573 RepID=A0A0U1LRP8_TALIS|nr:hypothetical protein PISL3812_03051 [Talaromyces islandicus]